MIHFYAFGIGENAQQKPAINQEKPDKNETGKCWIFRQKRTRIPRVRSQNSVSRGCYSGISRHVKTPRIGGAAIWHDNPIRVRKLMQWSTQDSCCCQGGMCDFVQSHQVLYRAHFPGMRGVRWMGKRVDNLDIRFKSHFIVGPYGDNNPR